MTLINMAQTLGLIAGIFIALGVILKAIYQLWIFGRMLNKAYNWIEKIYLEFQPNDGHSLSDYLERIDENNQINARNIHTIYGVHLKMTNIDPSLAPLLESLKAASPRQKDESWQ